MPDILDSSALLSTLPKLTPDNCEIKSPQDAIALLLHTIFSALSFRLIQLGDTSSRREYSDNKLSEEWNSQSPNHFEFCYRHEQSSLEFVIKVVKLSERTLINGIATASEKTATVDIKTSDYTSGAFFPHKIASNDPLVHGFISSNRVSDLVSIIKLKLISSILPGLHKEGYQEQQATSNANQRRDQTSGTRDRPPSPARPRPPENDPWQQVTPGPYTPHIPPVGRSDLDAIPQNPFAPPSLFPAHGGDGMFVGPDHPLLGVGGQNPSRGGRGPWVGDGFLPPMGAPPGARFDPIMPGPAGLPRPSANYFPNRPRRLGEPDNDEFMPPGAGDMFM